MCVKLPNQEVGSANTIITKDTSVPSIGNVIVSNQNTVSADSSITFTCSE
jgi:hypothetical protein